MRAKNVFGITGWKNSAKTTLIVALVEEFTRRGLRVSTIKHAHHAFDIDIPGEDSHRLSVVAVATNHPDRVQGRTAFALNDIAGIADFICHVCGVAGGRVRQPASASNHAR